LGISDRYYFDWLSGALERFEVEQGCFAALRREGRELALWSFAGQRENPPLTFLLEALGRDQTRVAFFDKFPSEPRVTVLDINALEALPDSSCDVLTFFRASYFITDPPGFLAHTQRLLRPGGLAVIDWLHGLSNAPVLDLRGDPGYGGASTPYLTTYADPQFLSEFPAEFEAFIRHVNRPPSWANPDRPGRAVPLSERARRLLGGGPGGQLTAEGYLDTLRAELERARKHLIEPALMEQHFKVVFRDARYLYRFVKKFNLYLLTVLRPVAK
jgi:SAM-dependent methyltransferase